MTIRPDPAPARTSRLRRDRHVGMPDPAPARTSRLRRDRHVSDPELRSALDGVDGWFSPDQVERLARLAAAVPAGGRIVEIGSFRGRSTIVIGRSAPPGVEIVAIDPHAGNDRGPQEIEGFAEEASLDHKVFLANLERARVRQRITHVRKLSHDAHGDVADPINLLHIDGAHRFRPASDDIGGWGDRAVAEGAMLIHDSFSSIGVTLAILARLVPSSRWRYVGRSGSLAEYRAEPVRGAARLANAARQLAQLPWFARNVAIKLLISAHLGKLTRLLRHDGQTWPY